ncbi:uncharacterized protein LOC130809229 [Amaranthus tricolor]|uniref:uncharacterized protein LOC130809229 n=1 Tax=Amaranthus tricolor TaxID=29722 RepID=UPI0025903D57|nr:uncharacterized protein LOC130809229 [Amaranthus tricolor]
MTARIRVWYAKSLSYAARLQLVNSILMSITNYWCQAVILPKKVIRQMNAICRSFLWSGSTESRTLGISARKKCALKIRDLESRNVATVGKVAWHISILHESLWVKWIHEVYTKDKMTARIRVWYAKNLSYAARLQLVNSILMSITNYWCQAVILPKKVIRQMNAICRSFLWSGSTESRTLGISARKKCALKIRDLESRNVATVGKVAWHISILHESLWVKWIHEMNTLAYSITKVYNDIRGGGNRVRWNHFVWSMLTIPRSRFIAWLAFNNRLKIKHRLKRTRTIDYDTCPICELESETVNHIFFQCRFSQECVAYLKERYETNNKIETLEDTLKRNQMGRHKRKQFEAILCNLIYAIWSARNEAAWSHKVPMVKLVVDNVIDISEIKFKIRLQLLSLELHDRCCFGPDHYILG